MAIAEDWNYKRIWSWKHPFIKSLPVAWIVEGTSTLQCLCPFCDYAKGYNEPILVVGVIFKELKCKTCGIEFYGPSLEQ